MKKIIQTIIWVQLANICFLDFTDAKTIIPNAYKRFMAEDFSVSNLSFSKELKRAISYYSEVKDFLDS